VQLSVVVITYNEEAKLARCLSSVRDLADEIVVVDSHSTDATRQIARGFGARVIEQPFLGYVEQKNFALAQATHHHVLSIDADEMLSPELSAAIAQVKADWQADGYTMHRLTNYCGLWVRYAGWYPDTKLRLADRRRAKWTGLNPHDHLELIAGGRCRHLLGDLLHYSYGTVTEHVAQQNRFSSMAAHSYYHKGRRSSVLRILLAPTYKFWRDYLFMRGFLHGYYGLVLCTVSAYSVFMKYVKLYELQHGKSI
jgi:glycosyltransferase involved in cell wall biosynthesis